MYNLCSILLLKEQATNDDEQSMLGAFMLTLMLNIHCVREFLLVVTDPAASSPQSRLSPHHTKINAKK